MTDTIIIGAGIIGCAIAERLASEGRRVRVLDPRRAGGGASQASAGVLAPLIEGHSSETLRRLGQRSLGMYDTFLDRVGGAAAVEYRRNGTIEVALTEDDARRLGQAATVLAAEGVEAELVASSALAAWAPYVAPRATAALIVQEHGYVNVPALTAALARAAADAGAIFDTARVTAIARGVGKVVVTTETGALAAETVVLAAGSWAGGLPIEDAEPVPVRPVRGQLLYLCDEPGAIDRVVWGRDCYLVPWTDGTVLVGATVEDVGFDERATADGVAGLLAAATALVPRLAHAAFGGVRVGLRPGSPDELPFVGISACVPGLVYATGHYRNGILLAPLTAELVARVVAGDTTDPALHALRPSRGGRL
ncbi:MAG: glycine oxidase ThiO [Vicinamibacterales bacterium]